MKEHKQETPYSSPWGFRERISLLAWEYVWLLLCIWTPKPLNRWRLFWLRMFGCQIHGIPFVHQRARIAIPWNLVLHDRACLGDRANAYSLGPIEIHAHATIAQEAYLCTGTHAFNSPTRNLTTSKITVQNNAFVGARAFVMPGVQIGSNSIVGACSVVTRSVPANSIATGNPARFRGIDT